MVHKRKSAMLTAGDLAYLVKHKELETPIGNIKFIGTKKSFEATYKHLFGKKQIGSGRINPFDRGK